eukprot:7090108-Prymnesium_polylepis.1
MAHDDYLLDLSSSCTSCQCQRHRRARERLSVRERGVNGLGIAERQNRSPSKAQIVMPSSHNSCLALRNRLPASIDGANKGPRARMMTRPGP